MRRPLFITIAAACAIALAVSAGAVVSALTPGEQAGVAQDIQPLELTGNSSPTPTATPTGKPTTTPRPTSTPSATPTGPVPVTPVAPHTVDDHGGRGKDDSGGSGKGKGSDD